jgi:ATP-dependent Clp protease ATP-binding subunit ClpA
MNLEKFTDRAKGFLQAAQTLAIRLSHQRITPEHVLKALLEDQEGMASGLIQRAGGNPAVALADVDKALGKFPQSPARARRLRRGWTTIPCACSTRPSRSRPRAATAS